MLDEYVALGAYKNPRLGLPSSDTKPTPKGDGTYASFTEASIYHSPATGAHAVYGTINAKYTLHGAETSIVGYPIADETDTPTGKRQEFQTGYIEWNTAANTLTFAAKK